MSMTIHKPVKVYVAVQADFNVDGILLPRIIT